MERIVKPSASPGIEAMKQRLAELDVRGPRCFDRVLHLEASVLYSADNAMKRATPLTMLAARLHGPRDVRVEEVPVPGQGEVLVRVTATGICGSSCKMLRAIST